MQNIQVVTDLRSGFHPKFQRTYTLSKIFTHFCCFFMITMSGRKFLLLPAFLLVIMFNLEPRVAESNNTVRCREEERKALVIFKQGLVDESDYLSSWGIENDKKDCCKWRGVRCSNKTGNVIVLNLQVSPDSQPLKGTISPSLLKLNYLRRLNLNFNNFSGSRMPEYIGSLSKLRYLSLSGTEFAGPIPPQLGNLSRLQYLDLSFNKLFSVRNLEWLSHLSSLRYLNLNENNLSESGDWLQVVDGLSSLTTLNLRECNLQPIIPSSLLHLNFSTPLETIDVAYNYLTTSIYPWLFNLSSSNLIDLVLDSNLLQGSIPDAFRHMTSLGDLSLSSNNLGGEIPNIFGNMCSLYSLDLSYNNLKAEFPRFIQNLLGECTENTLEQLNLDDNKITGVIPDLTNFSSLSELSLNSNRLNGTIPKSIGHMFELQVLDIGGNLLEGVISEAFFSNLSFLQELHLADNSLTLELSDDWVPPFQLQVLSLASCKMGHHFPKWLQTQNQILALDISNVGISDNFSDWFWDLPSGLSELNISHNQIKGELPDLSLRFDPYGPGIDISSNHFEGPIPPLPQNASFLNLSRNKFSGSISFICSTSGHRLVYLDLSSNLLSGKLPDCWVKFDSLSILNLANNGFSGEIPNSLGFLHNILTLSLHNNKLSGELPSVLKNCSQLRVIDLGKNALSGKIPTWIGESLPNLVVVSLQSNNFHGNIPFQLCHHAYLQILDLSLNNISGSIPICFNNFTAITQNMSFNPTITSHYFASIGSDRISVRHDYFDNALLTWKGSQYEYSTTLGLVRSLDLSSNQLSGAVPEEIMDLVGLIALNLSRNNLTGTITPKIGQLKSLDFLDLSRNQFFGQIPWSLSQLNRVSDMDLSYNNLSGKIPLGTQLQSFNASMYAGNPELCGLPLPNECPGEEPVHGLGFTRGREDAANTLEDEDRFITLGFYVSMIVGFIAGFWVVCGSLMLISSWRYAYFNFLAAIKDWLYVKAAVKFSKLQRRLRI